jgi:glycosyltransferase involved in cell wall biosynthesis
MAHPAAAIACERTAARRIRRRPVGTTLLFPMDGNESSPLPGKHAIVAALLRIADVMMTYAAAGGPRVAYFSDSVPPIADGVSRTLCRLAETLLEDRFDFRFFSAVKQGPECSWADRVHKVPAIPFPLYPEYRIALPVAGSLDPPVAGFRPDQVHVVSPTPLGTYGLDVARRRRVRAVGSFHTDFVSYLPFYGLSGFELQGWRYLRWFYNRCAVTFAPSADTRAKLQRYGIGPVELWERGIDGRAFAPAFRSEALRQRLRVFDEPVLLYVGRLVREKNLLDLVAAAHLLARWGHRVRARAGG